jgi:hypothetical protein
MGAAKSGEMWVKLRASGLQDAKAKKVWVCYGPFHALHTDG